MKIKEPSLKKSKAKAWKAFSLYIRTRGSRDGMNKCITCGRVYPIKQIGGLQAGHFIQGRHVSILFDERNCHPQCYGCNVMKRGNMVEYYEFMLKTYGQGVINELKRLDRQVKIMKPFMYDEIAEKYKVLLEDLTNN